MRGCVDDIIASMEIVKIKDVNLNKITSILNSGGLVIFPSETTYGAAVDATNKTAVRKLNNYKKRPFGKPYSIAVSDQAMAEKYALLNDNAKALYKNFLPGPLTVVSKGKGKVAPGIQSEDGTIGVRIPKYPLIIDIVKTLGRPITATSANASYKKRPYKIADILDNLSDKQKKLIDLIIDAGTLPPNEPSTVIDTTLDDPTVLRQGKIKLKNANKILSRSPENTENFAKELFQKCERYVGTRAIVFALEGPMGAGKTQFTKGLGRAMGIKEEVISPTYNLEEEYDKGKLIHIDAWRMGEKDSLNELGFGKRINDKSVISIEWAERVANDIRKVSEEAIIIWVKLIYAKNDNERIISWGAL
jgi:L-threonylcarbamoyladenylate synthase